MAIGNPPRTRVDIQNWRILNNITSKIIFLTNQMSPLTLPSPGMEENPEPVGTLYQKFVNPLIWCVRLYPDLKQPCTGVFTHMTIWWTAMAHQTQTILVRSFLHIIWRKWLCFMFFYIFSSKLSHNVTLIDNVCKKTEATVHWSLHTHDNLMAGNGTSESNTTCTEFPPYHMA
jgi:hypothetical protein